MKIRLLNFPTSKCERAIELLSQSGHDAEKMDIESLVNSPRINYTVPLVLVYTQVVQAEAGLLYQTLARQYPAVNAWLVSPSYRPEDVRTAFIEGYKNYILWSEDLADIRNAIDRLSERGVRATETDSLRNIYMLVSYPLEQQLVNDRILSAITEGNCTLASGYYPLLSRYNLLQNHLFSICILRPLFRLEDYLREDYEEFVGISINQLRSHMEWVQSTTNLPFQLIHCVKGHQVICLFCFPEYGNHERLLVSYLERVNERVRCYSKFSLLAGYSHFYSEITQTSFYYRNISLNMKQGSHSGLPCAVRMSEETAYINHSIEIDDYMTKNLSIAVDNHDTEFFFNTLSEACRMLVESRVKSTVADSMLLSMIVRFAQDTDFYLYIRQDFVEVRLSEILQRMVSFGLKQDLIRTIADAYARARSGAALNDNNRLSIAMQYIRNNYRRKLTLSSIASYLALNPNYFCTWFKTNTGRNFSDVITDYRIDAAKEMLAHSNKKICDIASETGYEEIVSFNRVFKKTVGMTPNQYRLQQHPVSS